MSKLAELKARRILDSRGQWTIEVEALDEDGNIAVSSVPQGKSTGTHEAHSVEVDEAVSNVEKRILPELRGIEVIEQAAIDKKLNEIDGTSNKQELGGNSILAVSIAVCRLGAKQAGVPLWKHIRSIAKITDEAPPPRLFANLINGGLHADNGLRFQEYMAIPKVRTLPEAVDTVQKIYAELRAVLASTGGSGSTGLGDEGGFAPNFNDDEKPFEVLSDVLRKLKLSEDVDFGMDAAVSTIDASEEELSSTYQKMVGAFPLVYLEDPFGEEEFEAFSNLLEELPDDVHIVGDDLTVTNVTRMNMAQEKKSANAMIIKPNQIGSVTEAIDAVLQARAWDWHVIASHRSGETLDTFISDFAYGVYADGFKLGAPARGERVAKYNRLLEIVEEDK